MLEKHIKGYESFEDLVEALEREDIQTVYILDKEGVVLMKYEDYKSFFGQ